jgi:hypothetical protein
MHEQDKKAHDSGIGIALGRQRQPVVASAVGAGSKRACQRLWEAIAQGARQGHGFRDLLKVYACVIPEEQHTAVGSRDGRNGSRGALEQHPAAASGPFCAHDVLMFPVGAHATPACLHLFLHRSNSERAILLK